MDTMIGVETFLFEKAKSGKAKAFEDLILKYEKSIYNTAYRIMGNYEDARDMSQESLIKAYKNIRNCADVTHFRRLLYVITTNTCLDELRKRKNRVNVPIDSMIDNTDDSSPKRQFVSEEATPEERLINKELSVKIQNAINQLPDDQKAAIVLRDIRGLSYEEVAEAMSSSIGTVKSRLSRARARLRTLLSNNGELNFELNVKEYNRKG